MPPHPKSCLIVMGVSGAGKSTIAHAVAELLSAEYKDGDALHPQANIDKMAAGTPLTDEDRWPWLDAIRQYAVNSPDAVVVIACSALKKTYRDFIRDAPMTVWFLYLKGSEKLLMERMKERSGHFMKQSMLKSQLQTLESPEGEPGCITINIDQDLADVIKSAEQALRKHDAFSHRLPPS